MSEQPSGLSGQSPWQRVAELEKANAKLSLQVRYLEQQHSRLAAEAATLKQEIHLVIGELGQVVRECNRVEAKLKESKEYYQGLFEGSPTAYELQDWTAIKGYFDQCRAAGIVDFEQYFNERPDEVTRLLGLVKIVQVNESARKLYKADSKSELLGGLGAFKPEGSDRDFFKQLVAFAQGETLYESETTNFTISGETIYIALRKAVIAGFEHNLSRVLTAMTDVTARKQANAQLQASLREKEILLREIHHRVKNNLQLVSGLLDLSTHHAHATNAVALLEDARSRVHTMGLVHTQLYKSNRFDAIKMEQHIRELALYLSQTHAREDRHIEVLVDPSDVELTVSQAIPCALVINELISNSFRHAFQDRASGEIQVSIHQDAHRVVHACVRDDGSGISPQIDLARPRTLGLQLVINLVQRQLKGDVTIIEDGGTVVDISFDPTSR